MRSSERKISWTSGTVIVTRKSWGILSNIGSYWQFAKASSMFIGKFRGQFDHTFRRSERRSWTMFEQTAQWGEHLFCFSHSAVINSRFEYYVKQLLDNFIASLVWPKANLIEIKSVPCCKCSDSVTTFILRKIPDNSIKCFHGSPKAILRHWPLTKWTQLLKSREFPHQNWSLKAILRHWWSWQKAINISSSIFELHICSCNLKIYHLQFANFVSVI